MPLYVGHDGSAAAADVNGGDGTTGGHNSGLPLPTVHRQGGGDSREDSMLIVSQGTTVGGNGSGAPVVCSAAIDAYHPHHGQDNHHQQLAPARGGGPGQAFGYDQKPSTQLHHHHHQPENNSYSIPNCVAGVASTLVSPPPVPVTMEGTARGAATGAANATIGSNGAGGHNNAGDAAAAAAAATKKKRLCKIEGCQRVIKSQGLCQRHGASAKRCKVQGCDKQAQGTHSGMCKRHWKEINSPDSGRPKGNPPPPPEGESVYESILPASISYRPTIINSSKLIKGAAAAGNDISTSVGDDNGGRTREITVRTDALGELSAPDEHMINIMPLVLFLKEGRDKEFGWHRNKERRARGMFPCASLTVQLEPWERQLALVEILLLSGGTPHANFKDLAHAWGREKGFHTIITNNVCQRKGEVERKRRSDVGKVLNTPDRETSKLKNNNSKRPRRESWEPENGQIQQQLLHAPAQQSLSAQPPTAMPFQNEYHGHVGLHASQMQQHQPHLMAVVPGQRQQGQHGQQNMIHYGQQPVVDAGAVAAAAALAAGGPMDLHQQDNTAEV